MLTVTDHVILSLNPIAEAVKHAVTLNQAEDFDAALDREFTTVKKMLLRTDEPAKLGEIMAASLDVGAALLGLNGDGTGEKVENFMTRLRTLAADEEVLDHVEKVAPDALQHDHYHDALDIESTVKVEKGAQFNGYL